MSDRQRYISPSNRSNFLSKFIKIAALLLLTARCANANAQTISATDQKGIEEGYNGFMAVDMPKQ